MVERTTTENSDINPQRSPRKRETPVGVPAKPFDFFKNKNFNFDQNSGFHGGASRRKGYRLALWSCLASFIDGLVLLSLTCLFAAVFSWAAKEYLGATLSGIFHGQNRIAFFAEIYLMCAWIYLITVRSVTGSTFGEWACNLRLGQPHERLHSTYTLRVIWRTTLILVTGVILLPVLSLIFGQDVAGVISGLRLFSLK